VRKVQPERSARQRRKNQDNVGENRERRMNSKEVHAERGGGGRGNQERGRWEYWRGEPCLSHPKGEISCDFKKAARIVGRGISEPGKEILDIRGSRERPRGSGPLGDKEKPRQGALTQGEEEKREVHRKRKPVKSFGKNPSEKIRIRHLLIKG